MSRDFDVVLVLSGGNALGAFEAGFYEVLHEQGLLPDWIVGASIGAINGALIAGTRIEARIETLRRFWRPESFGMAQPGTHWLPSGVEIARRTAAVTWTLAAGRRGTFGPLLSAMTPWTDDKPSIFETDELEATLKAMVDFDELNTGECRYTVTAVDLATGEDVVFDTCSARIEACHIRASAALPVLFPPVEVDGRWLVDGGVSANLPLDPVLAEPSGRRTLCIAVDLLPLAGPRPTTIGEAASRLQDLTFAAQSRRAIERWQGVYRERDGAGITLVRLAYTDQRHEVAGKALDFSGPTIEQRWQAGRLAAERLMERVTSGELPDAAPGLHLVS